MYVKYGLGELARNLGVIWEYSNTILDVADGGCFDRGNVDKGDNGFSDGWARGLVRLRRLTDNQKIKSSNLFGPTNLRVQMQG